MQCERGFEALRRTGAAAGPGLGPGLGRGRVVLVVVVVAVATAAVAGTGCTTDNLTFCAPGAVCTDTGGGSADDAAPDAGDEDGYLTWDRYVAPPPDVGFTCPAGTTRCGQGYCCTKDQICTGGKCLGLGPKCDELWPCPTGYFCDKTQGRCVPGKQTCEYRPPVGAFSPKVEWEWQGSTDAPSSKQVMMTPMVANLTDDNGDGKIDRDDIPDIVFMTFASSYWVGGVLRAISGDGKKEHFAVTDAANATTPGAGVAIADIDGDKKPEIVTCGESVGGKPGPVVAFENDGKPKWKSSDPNVTCGFAGPAIADLDGDGKPEVVVRYAALEGATGKTRWVARTITAGWSVSDYPTVADIDEDGKPEVVGGNVVFRNDGKLMWEDKSREDGYPAVADLDGDGKPEIVTATRSDHALWAHRADGKKVWGPVDINPTGQTLSGGGPPTIADFDGDSKPEIATAGGYGYVVFEHDGKRKWFQNTQDLSSRFTGSSVFDFEGDGKAEAVYSDEKVLRIYRGADGHVLYVHCNTSGTLWEYPLIVDVDNDNHAEIVVSNNNYNSSLNKCPDGSASHTGIKVISDAQNRWVRTRRIWNQHTYHVTNVDEDGVVPAKEARNWDNPNLNNFRQNVQPGGLFDAPDLTGAPGKVACATTITATVDVHNQGAARVAPGLKVTLYGKLGTAGPVALATVSTKKPLYPGQHETVALTAQTPKAWHQKTVTFYVMVDDDGKGNGSENECKETNNRADLGNAVCKVIG